MQEEYECSNQYSGEQSLVLVVVAVYLFIYLFIFLFHFVYAVKMTSPISVTTPAPAAVSECREWAASAVYSKVRGMSGWCNAVCKTGSCPASHCVCLRIGKFCLSYYSGTSK